MLMRRFKFALQMLLLLILLVVLPGFLLWQVSKPKPLPPEAQQIKDLQRRYPKVIGHTDGMGMALRIEVCGEDGFQPDRELTDRMFAEGMKGDLIARGARMGLVLDVGGYYKNVFTLAPSFEITEDEIDLGVELLEQLIRRCAPGRV